MKIKKLLYYITFQIGVNCIGLPQFHTIFFNKYQSVHENKFLKNKYAR